MEVYITPPHTHTHLEASHVNPWLKAIPVVMEACLSGTSGKEGDSGRPPKQVLGRGDMVWT